METKINIKAQVLLPLQAFKSVRMVCIQQKYRLLLFRVQDRYEQNQ